MIYDLAATFREVGAAAVQTILKKQNGDFFIPAAVNTAFAVELLLKFFIVAANPDLTYPELKARGLHPHGHKYSELWDKLHPKFREPSLQNIRCSRRRARCSGHSRRTRGTR